MTDLSTMPDLISEAMRLSRLIDKGVDALRRAASDAATAEHVYRKAKAAAWATVRSEGDRTAAHMQAEVEFRTADQRLERDLAEGERQAALEALRSRRQQLSAVQSLAAAHRAEAEHARYGVDA